MHIADDILKVLIDGLILIKFNFVSYLLAYFSFLYFLFPFFLSFYSEITSNKKSELIEQVVKNGILKVIFLKSISCEDTKLCVW